MEVIQCHRMESVWKAPAGIAYLTEWHVFSNLIFCWADYSTKYVILIYFWQELKENVHICCNGIIEIHLSEIARPNGMANYSVANVNGC